MPDPIETAGSLYAHEVSELARSGSTTEETYYPAIRNLLSALLTAKRLPYRVRTATSEDRTGGGTDHPDFAFYGSGGTLLVAAGEVKLPNVHLETLARSTERNNQIGRYLGQTGVVVLSNVCSYGLLTIRPGVPRNPCIPVAPDGRDLVSVIDLWPSERAFRDGRAIQRRQLNALADLVEQAVTAFAPIADPEVLARVLAQQARKAMADLPPRFDAVQSLLEDYGVALGLTFEGEEGLEFFRSSLVQTAFYALFASWALWHRENDGTEFDWHRVDQYLKIPFLGQLFYEFRHPDRLEELHLGPHLDRATQTLRRVDRTAFFATFQAPEVLRDDADGAGVPAAAITYFYEPFLEAFDPDLRKELGVWYTPPEIVRYQVRKIDRLLRDELGCIRGFADENVVVLDPVCGTGAYLVEVVRCIARQLHTEGQTNTLGAQILEAVCSRIVGFEILTASFVIAQLQLYLLLSNLGATPGRRQRPAVFLTNALTGWSDPTQVQFHFPELRTEHDAAQNVKQRARIIVVLGNPPYNRFAGAAVKEEADLVDHYKGIIREKEGRQVGQTLLFEKWGVRKQLLDDLYIRFIRLGEKRIGEVAEFGIVSFISNSSFLTGRSHPLMRESLLRNFHSILVDNLNGDKYRTGKMIPKGLPGEGTADQSIFTTEQDPRGIQVGTCITTYTKRRAAPTSPTGTFLGYRDFWGRAADKRRALLESLGWSDRPERERREVAERAQGPREYEPVTPTEANRWMFSPRDMNVGYEAWPGLDELFPVLFQGVNPNRGLDGSIIDTDREILIERMRAYYAATRFSQAKEAAPTLCESRARYDPEAVWRRLKGIERFEESRVVPYLLFPLDTRWIYYESEGKLLNERRPEFWENRTGNEFLVAVPQPRRISETRPLLAKTLVDLHLHDRGSVCFPQKVRPGELFASSPPRANLSPEAWEVFSHAWGLQGDLTGREACELVSMLFRAAVAVMHAPQYQADHRDGLAQDWAQLPVPKSRELFQRLSALGGSVACLLDPSEDVNTILGEVLGDATRSLGVVSHESGRRIRGEELTVEYVYYGAGVGKWLEREFRDDEVAFPAWGTTTGDLYLNRSVYVADVPAGVWRYELGGYPVLKKWLGYRQASRRARQPLSLAEMRHFRSMIQRLAALLVIHERLDETYSSVAEDAFTAEELGLRQAVSPAPSA